MNSANHLIAISHLIASLENSELSVLLFLLNTNIIPKVKVSQTCRAIVLLLDEMDDIDWQAINHYTCQMLTNRLENRPCVRLFNEPVKHDPFAELERRLSLPLSDLEDITVDNDETGDRGDSLPTPIITKEELDNELDEYFNSKETTLSDIEWEFKTRNCPYARFTPISINGVVFSKCNLYNLSYLIGQGLQLGSIIQIKKTGNSSHIASVISKGTHRIVPLCPKCPNLMKLLDGEIICKTCGLSKTF